MAPGEKESRPPQAGRSAEPVSDTGQPAFVCDHPLVFSAGLPSEFSPRGKKAGAAEITGVRARSLTLDATIAPRGVPSPPTLLRKVSPSNPHT